MECIFYQKDFCMKKSTIPWKFVRHVCCLFATLSTDAEISKIHYSKSYQFASFGTRNPSWIHEFPLILIIFLGKIGRIGMFIFKGSSRNEYEIVIYYKYILLMCTMKWNLSVFKIKKCQLMNTRKGIFCCMVEMSAMIKLFWKLCRG